MEMRRKLVLVTAAVGVSVTVAVLVLLAAELAELAPPELPDWGVPVYVAIQIGLPAAAATWMWRTLSRQMDGTPRQAVRTHQVRWGLIAGAYAITAIFGSPAVQSESTRWAVSEYKTLKATESSRVFEQHPYIWTYAAVPIAPGVIVSYHEHQLDGLYGFGGFDLSIWYVVGVKSLGAIPLWLS